jgi:hypothetical protein
VEVGNQSVSNKFSSVEISALGAVLDQTWRILLQIPDSNVVSKVGIFVILVAGLVTISACWKRSYSRRAFQQDHKEDDRDKERFHGNFENSRKELND